jgi:putative PIN family toxin of toxin-antitoxin system
MKPNRVVLDTNVCLDLFVFHDPRWNMLYNALLAGAIDAVTRDDCRREWQIVLGYPHLPLDAASRAHGIAEFDRLIPCLPPDAIVPQTEIRLPICKDRDDQKFLELARDAHAQVLITKDKALLKLAKRNAKAGLFRIIPPEAWQADI